MSASVESSETLERVLRHARDHLPDTLERLQSYLRHPSISVDPQHHADVRQLANRVHQDLVGMGLVSRVLELDRALPLVTAELAKPRPDRPTVLLYGHLDVQPVRGEPWTNPPHDPVIKDGRLYARGASDDMGGWAAHCAAIQAWLEVTGSVPVNVKLLIESEEEIGSPNLERYMQAYPEAFAGDLMVLTDGENPSSDIPGLTVSLRGVFQVEVVCEALGADVHSGLWGNVVPDAGNALILLLARLLDENGRLRLGRSELPPSTRAALAKVPCDPKVIRGATRMLDGVLPLPTEGRSAAEWLWHQPAITLLSTTFPTPSEHKNAVRGRASATLSIRTAPGQDTERIMQLLGAELLGDSPGGVRISLGTPTREGQSWLCKPEGPVFAAADRAYASTWGRPLMRIGLGGTIPFVAQLARRRPELPLILNGVLDPDSGAHGPDESLHLGVFEKTVLATIRLFHELVPR
jgi:acetylornithine deacetylase/succinyl-diaminopimelate desuccinylase-like protein